MLRVTGRIIRAGERASCFTMPLIWTFKAPPLCLRLSNCRSVFTKHTQINTMAGLPSLTRCNLLGSSSVWLHRLPGLFQRCYMSTNRPSVALKKRHRTVLAYISALVVLTVGLSYAAVPLYRMYCQATGLGGTVKLVDVGDQIETMTRKPERLLTIKFNADTSKMLQWRFKPQQSEIKLVPGETALAFYKAQNLTDKPITGISTYNVVPFEAGQYFNKIQCFCFEEQRLNPNEEVDMPVFFYIDPDIIEDPGLAKTDTITLSYTFFEAKEGSALGLQVQQHGQER